MAYKHKIKNIQEILLNSFNNSEIKYKFIVSLICRDWPDIIGEPLCKFTRPAYIYNNILHVACMHGGIIQTLNFRSDEIYQKLLEHDYHYKIEGIKFIPESKAH